MVTAACTLAELGVPLAGDVIVNTVTEEESTGAGGLFAARLLQADAAIVPEPSGLAVWVACRGSLLPRITVRGRAGHAGIAPAPARAGRRRERDREDGVVLGAVERLREHWAMRPRHPYLSAGDCVPTIITGGEWLVSYPATCALECHIEYLPDRADEHGYGSEVEREFEHWIAEAAARRRVAPRASARDHVGRRRRATFRGRRKRAHRAGAARGRAATSGSSTSLGGLDNWHDGATLTVEAGHPGGLLRPGRRPPRTRGRRVRADRRPRRLRPAHRAGGHALLR